MVKRFKRSLGLLGGSFDPVHKGHLVISKIAIKKLKLNKVFWLITRKNPFKDEPFYSLSKRIQKAKVIAKRNKKICVKYLDEVVGSSRSVDLIEYLINKKKHKNIHFIVGSDNLIKFHKWKSWKKIVKLTQLVVFSRSGYDKKGKKSIVAKYLKNRIIFINNKPIAISSTKIRKKAKKDN